MAVSAHAHLKWLKWSKMWPNWQNFRFSTKPGTENLILHSIFEAEVQSKLFLRMRNSKLGKQPMRRRGPFATTSHRPTKGNLSCTTLLIKWLSDVQRMVLSVTTAGRALIGLA